MSDREARRARGECTLVVRDGWVLGWEEYRPGKRIRIVAWPAPKEPESPRRKSNRRRG